MFPEYKNDFIDDFPCVYAPKIIKYAQMCRRDVYKAARNIKNGKSKYSLVPFKNTTEASIQTLHSIGTISNFY